MTEDVKLVDSSAEHPEIPPKEPLKIKIDPVPGLVFELFTNPEKTEASLSILGFPEEFNPEEASQKFAHELKFHFGEFLLPQFLNEELPRIFANRSMFQDRLIAKSFGPVDGIDAVVTVLIPRPTREFLIRDDGTCDFKTRDLFRSVSENEVILTRIPPAPAIVGKTVLGKDIPARPARDTRVVLGKNVKLVVEMGIEKVLATSSGQVMVEQRVNSLMVQIIPVLLISKDVDYSTGNINFKGAVDIRGSVLTGFSVIATGNVIIHGLIEPEAKVTAGGDLVVYKGILGTGKSDDKSEVKSFGNLQALYAENACLTAEGDIFLRTAMNCRIHTSKNLLVERALIGGTVNAFRAIEAGEIGNDINMHTFVQSGVSHAAITRINLMVKVLDELKGKLAEAEKNLSFVARRGMDLPETQRENLTHSLTQQVETLRDQITKLEVKKADVALAMLEENQATISARMFFPGVTVQIISTRRIIEQKTQAATFFRKMPEEKIESRSYNPEKRARSERRTSFSGR